MAEAPSFPRPAEIAIMMDGTRVQASPAFARWLDQFLTGANTAIVATEAANLAPQALPSQTTPSDIAPIILGSQQAKDLSPL